MVPRIFLVEKYIVCSCLSSFDTGSVYGIMVSSHIRIHTFTFNYMDHRMSDVR